MRDKNTKYEQYFTDFIDLEIMFYKELTYEKHLFDETKYLSYEVVELLNIGLLFSGLITISIMFESIVFENVCLLLEQDASRLSILNKDLTEDFLITNKNNYAGDTFTEIFSRLTQDKEIKLNAFHYEAIKLIKHPSKENKHLRFNLSQYLRFLNDQGGISESEYLFFKKFADIRNTLIHCRINHTIDDMYNNFPTERKQFFIKLNEYSYRTRGEKRFSGDGFDEFIESECLFLIGMFRKSIQILVKRRMQNI